MTKKINNLIVEISNILGISATGRLILSSLVETKKRLSVPEITAEIKRSERSVRAQLKILTKLELVKKEIMITKEGRLAYQYFVPRIDGLAKSVKKEMIRRLRRLEMYMKGIGGR
ncbi:MAG TPA: hypothetical protein ENG51_15930 [Deltaproteobacteria bacterium]|nr:MAG: hypothetical protein DRN83_02725 [Hadesarchaea archaeon]HDM77931.1 hypothetical protein [Deltaproteobacteria bacterium]